jgi:hypothetical protein
MGTATPNEVVSDWAELRRLAVAADEQMSNGPTEWPGRPSRQRLELFLAASPKTVLSLLDELERLQEEAA